MPLFSPSCSVVKGFPKSQNDINKGKDGTLLNAKVNILIAQSTTRTPFQKGKNTKIRIRMVNTPSGAQVTCFKLKLRHRPASYHTFFVVYFLTIAQDSGGS